MWQHIKATCFNLFTVGEWRKYDFFFFFLFPPAAPGRRQTWVSPAVGSTPAQLESPGCLCNTPVIIVAINSFISQVIKCSWRAQQEVFFFPHCSKMSRFQRTGFFLLIWSSGERRCFSFLSCAHRRLKSNASGCKIWRCFYYTARSSM